MRTVFKFHYVKSCVRKCGKVVGITVQIMLLSKVLLESYAKILVILLLLLEKHKNLMQIYLKLMKTKW